MAGGWAVLGRRLVAVALVAVATGCASPAAEPRGEAPPGRTVEPAPERFTIAPDDYHVPYAGTAEDGRRFFLSEELFTTDAAYVGLFLWNADGTFDEVLVDEVARPAGVPPGHPGRAGTRRFVDTRLSELGDYVLEPVEVEPFTTTVDGVTFGWKVRRYDDGSYSIYVEPGDFISYYAPWDGSYDS